MTALSAPDWMPTSKPVPGPKGKSQRLPGSGQTLYHGAVICVDPSTGKFVEGIGTNPALIAYGFLDHEADYGIVDNSADLFTEEVFVQSDVRLMTFSGTSLADSHEGSTVFIVDDATMSISSNGGLRPIGGRLIEVVSTTSGYVHVDPVLSMMLAACQGLSTTQAQINIPLAPAILAAGTPMAAFADNASSNPGITLADSKAVAIRWNNNTTSTAVWFSVAMPQDLDDSAAIVFHFLVSKSGATLADATTMTVTAFFQTAAALHDADADCGGVSSALVGDATAKTVTELTLTIAAADVPPSPSNLSFSVKPTGAVTTTDDVILSGMWIEYTRKPLTA